MFEHPDAPRTGEEMSQAITIGHAGAKARSTRRPDLLAGIVRRAVRFGAMVAGALIMVTGVAIAPLPGPFGLPIAVVGLMLVLRNSMWAKREFIKAQHRWPRWLFPVRRLMRPKPQFVPVFWQTSLRTERLLTRGRGRFLRSLRRSLRGRARL